MVVVDKLEVWKGELRLQQGREFVLDRLGPLANEYDEFIDIPCHTASGHLGIVASDSWVIEYKDSLPGGVGYIVGYQPVRGNLNYFNKQK